MSLEWMKDIRWHFSTKHVIPFCPHKRLALLISMHAARAVRVCNAYDIYMHIRDGKCWPFALVWEWTWAIVAHWYILRGISEIQVVQKQQASAGSNQSQNTILPNKTRLINGHLFLTVCVFRFWDKDFFAKQIQVIYDFRFWDKNWAKRLTKRPIRQARKLCSLLHFLQFLDFSILSQNRLLLLWLPHCFVFSFVLTLFAQTYWFEGFFCLCGRWDIGNIYI